MNIPIFDIKNNDNRTLLALLFVIAFLFNVLSKRETSTILSIMLILIGMGMYYGFYYKNIIQKGESVLDSIVKNRIEATPSRSYYIKSFPPNGLKYLKENEKMLSIANNLLFLKVFDKGRYEDMLLLMDRLQKIYIYILVSRYECRQGINIFMDIRELLLNILYSFYLVLPMKTKHMYGLDPHKELDESIKNTTYLIRHMISVLENYARRDCKIPYLDQTLPSASDPMSSSNVMP